MFENNTIDAANVSMLGRAVRADSTPPSQPRAHLIAQEFAQGNQALHDALCSIEAAVDRLDGARPEVTGASNGKSEPPVGSALDALSKSTRDLFLLAERAHRAAKRLGDAV